MMSPGQAGTTGSGRNSRGYGDRDSTREECRLEPIGKIRYDAIHSQGHHFLNVLPIVHGVGEDHKTSMVTGFNQGLGDGAVIAADMSGLGILCRHDRVMRKPAEERHGHSPRISLPDGTHLVVHERSIDDLTCEARETDTLADLLSETIYFKLQD